MYFQYRGKILSLKILKCVRIFKCPPEQQRPPVNNKDHTMANKQHILHKQGRFDII